jgi:predicted DNA binding CopG/RHH family protein
MEFLMDDTQTKPVVKDIAWYVENQVLDEEEQEIARDLAAGLYVQTQDLETVKAEFKEAAENYRRKKPITIRLQQDDLLGLKAMSTKAGIPYQTLVSSIIHRYVTGQLKGEA